MSPASQPAPKRVSAVNRPKRWPERALGVLEDTTVRLADIGSGARSIDKQASAIDRMAALGVDAVRDGNAVLAQQIFLDIQQRTATVRHTAATILGTAGAASAALAGARVGEYSGE